MKKFIIKNAKVLVAFVIGLVISGGIVYAATLINADQVAYSSGTVEDALDDLYGTAAQIKAIKKFCELKSGTAGTVGAKYECDPGDGTKRNFYVLTVNNDNTVDLIMEYNLSDTVGTARTMTWNDAMKFFKTGAGASTKTAWTNVMNVDLPKAQAIADNAYNNATWNSGNPWIAADSGSTWFCFGTHAQDSQSSPYCNKTTNAPYAWLFNHLIGCTAAGCTDDSGATAYGYWTRDLISNTAHAWAVAWTGNLGTYPVSNSTPSGVRPVITVLKSNLYEAE